MPEAPQTIDAETPAVQSPDESPKANDAEAPAGPPSAGGSGGDEHMRGPAAELTVVADTRERFEFLLAHG